MINASMGKMMEMLAPSSVHVLQPTAPNQANGLAQDVYEQMREEFMVAGPFVLHGEVPELLAAAWCIVRETLFTGEAHRGHKEIVAWAVSESNVCPFCIGAHHAAVKASGIEEENDLEQWARCSSSSAVTAARLPQNEHRAEFVGTLVAFQYLNRMVSVFLDEKMMPLPRALDPITNSMAKVMMGGLIKKAENNERGGSLKLLADADMVHAWQPEWAQSDSNVAKAIGAWSSTIETVARRRLSSTLLAYLRSAIDDWQGGVITRSEISDVQLPTKFNQGDCHAATLALLTVMSPHTVQDEDVRAVVHSGWSNSDVLSLVAWSAQRAARRCATWTASRG